MQSLFSNGTAALWLMGWYLGVLKPRMAMRQRKHDISGGMVPLCFRWLVPVAKQPAVFPVPAKMPPRVFDAAPLKVIEPGEIWRACQLESFQPKLIILLSVGMGPLCHFSTSLLEWGWQPAKRERRELHDPEA